MPIKPADLRDVPEEWLTRELHARKHCVDCDTQWARGWYAFNPQRTRIICFRCKATRRLKERHARRERLPLLT